MAAGASSRRTRLPTLVPCPPSSSSSARALAPSPEMHGRLERRIYPSSVETQKEEASDDGGGTATECLNGDQEHVLRLRRDASGRELLTWAARRSRDDPHYSNLPLDPFLTLPLHPFLTLVALYFVLSTAQGKWRRRRRRRREPTTRSPPCSVPY
jgi:hypothetical protein